MPRKQHPQDLLLEHVRFDLNKIRNDNRIPLGVKIEQYQACILEFESLADLMTESEKNRVIEEVHKYIGAARLLLGGN